MTYVLTILENDTSLIRLVMHKNMKKQYNFVKIWNDHTLEIQI